MTRPYEPTLQQVQLALYKDDILDPAAIEDCYTYDVIRDLIERLNRGRQVTERDVDYLADQLTQEVLRLCYEPEPRYNTERY